MALERRRRGKGAVLPLYLASLFIMVGAFYLLHGIGWKLTQRMQVQNAADRAAYSAAGISARSLNLLEHVNTSLAAMRGLAAVYQGVSITYPQVMATACARAWFDWADDVVCSVMSSGSNAAIPGIAAARQTEVLGYAAALDALAETIVEETPEWAEETAVEIAQANFAEDAFAVASQNGRLPYERGGADEMKVRVQRIANHDYSGTDKSGWDNLVESDGTPDEVIFSYPYKPEYEAAYRGQIATAVQSLAGEYWKAQFDNFQEQREMLAITVFAMRTNEDAERLRKMNAANAADTPDVFEQRPEVAVARAEPYFTLTDDGRPDGRPGWSARLRPVHALNDDSRTSLAEAAGKGAGEKGWLSDWQPAFVAGPDGAEVPH